MSEFEVSLVISEIKTFPYSFICDFPSKRPFLFHRNLSFGRKILRLAFDNIDFELIYPGIFLEAPCELVVFLKVFPLLFLGKVLNYLLKIRPLLIILIRLNLDLPENILLCRLLLHEFINFFLLVMAYILIQLRLLSDYQNPWHLFLLYLLAVVFEFFDEEKSPLLLFLVFLDDGGGSRLPTLEEDALVDRADVDALFEAVVEAIVMSEVSTEKLADLGGVEAGVFHFEFNFLLTEHAVLRFLLQNQQTLLLMKGLKASQQVIDKIFSLIFLLLLN